MNISNLIQKLEIYKQDHGDLEICVPGEHYDTWNADCHLFVGFKEELDVWGFELACDYVSFESSTDEELEDEWGIEDRSKLQKVLLIG